MSLVVKQPTPRLFAIQGLRAYAAGFVTLVHALDTYREKVSSTLTTDFFEGLGLGGLGVKLFFCISGFIIYRSAIHYEKNVKSALFFMRRRIIRVAPIYWVATIIYALKLLAQGMPPSAIDLLKSFLFIPYPNEIGLMRPVLGQGWTLNYEMLFYLLFCLSILLLSRFRVYFLTMTLVVFFLMNILLPANDLSSYFYSCFYLLTDYYLLYFLIGLYISVIIDTASSKGFNYELDYRVAILLATLSLIIYFIIAQIFSISGFFLELAVVLCCSVCLFVCAIEHSSEIGSTHKFSLLLQTAGDASYSTYLTHGFVMGVTARFISKMGFDVTPLAFSCLMVFVCAGFGMLFYKLVEKPLLKKLNSYFG